MVAGKWNLIAARGLSEQAAMLNYRAYLIGPDDHIMQRIDFHCANEDDAKERAKQLVDGHDVELWLDDTLVERFRFKPYP